MASFLLGQCARQSKGAEDKPLAHFTRLQECERKQRTNKRDKKQTPICLSVTPLFPFLFLTLFAFTCSFIGVASPNTWTWTMTLPRHRHPYPNYVSSCIRILDAECQCPIRRSLQPLIHRLAIDQALHAVCASPDRICAPQVPHPPSSHFESSSAALISRRWRREKTK